MNPNRILAALLLLLTPVLLSAQTPEERTDVFAPFVSRIRVAVRDPQIRVTWRDSEDLTDGSYRVYRHTIEITSETIDDAELIAEVEPGVETFLDTPLEAGSYYYAVLAADADDRVYTIFIPFRNKTIRPVAVAQLDTEEDLAASVYNIAAQTEDTAIVVRFEASRADRTLAVYRSTVPFADAESIAAAALLDELPSSSRRYVDYPVPGVAYYYGVFDKRLVELAMVTIEPEENVLVEPVSLRLGAGADVTLALPESRLRPAPLPVLQLATAITSDRRLAQSDVPGGTVAQALRPGADAAIDRLLARAPRPQPFDPQPIILPEDRAPSAEGAPQTLAQILRGDFAAGNWGQAALLLDRLLQLPLSRTFEQRARFYRGQALYFDGRHEPAFMELLYASEGPLYPQVRPWLDGILLDRE